MSKKKPTPAQKAGFVSYAVNRDDILKKYIETHSNKMLTDEAKLSYFSEMLLKYRMDAKIKTFINELASNLGYVKEGNKWQKINKNS